MAWIVQLPPSPRHPKPRWQVRYQDGYAAKLTDPQQPRRSLQDKSKVPPRLAHATIRRNDELFSSIRNGPALRVVVDADDDQKMIQYAYLVASQRGHV